MNYEINEKGLDLLMLAVAKRAIKDYIAIKNGELSGSRQRNIKELREYFQSEIFEYAFPNISGKEMIALLESPQRNEILNRIVKEEITEERLKKRKELKKWRLKR